MDEEPNSTARETEKRLQAHLEEWVGRMKGAEENLRNSEKLDPTTKKKFPVRLGHKISNNKDKPAQSEYSIILQEAERLGLPACATSNLITALKKTPEQRREDIRRA